jgi:hypothetical protein
MGKHLRILQMTLPVLTVAKSQCFFFKAFTTAHARYVDWYEEPLPFLIGVGFFAVDIYGWSLRIVLSIKSQIRLTPTASKVGMIEYGANVAFSMPHSVAR